MIANVIILDGGPRGQSVSSGGVALSRESAVSQHHQHLIVGLVIPNGLKLGPRLRIVGVAHTSREVVQQPPYSASIVLVVFLNGAKRGLLNK